MRAIPERLRDASCGGAVQIDFLYLYRHTLREMICVTMRLFICINFATSASFAELCALSTECHSGCIEFICASDRPFCLSAHCLSILFPSVAPFTLTRLVNLGYQAGQRSETKLEDPQVSFG